MKNKIITRADIRKMLEDWQPGKVTARQVHEWAESRDAVSGVDYEDWEDDDESSVSNEIMGALDKLDMNLIIREDIPIYLEFLRTPKGSFSEAHQKIDAAIRDIDQKVRARHLKNDPLYERFCP